jgi:hypothetical protein
MELKDILAISGQPGLYKFVAQSMRGVIVESLIDGKRMNASATSRVSALTEISMFTEGEDIALADVFTNIWNYTEGKEAISHKESAERIEEEFAKANTREENLAALEELFDKYNVPEEDREEILKIHKSMVHQINDNFVAAFMADPLTEDIHLVPEE